MMRAVFVVVLTLSSVSLGFAGLPQAPLQPDGPSDGQVHQVELVQRMSLAGVGSPIKITDDEDARFLEVTGDMEDAFVNAHNAERTKWSLGSVTWSEAVATEAAAHAAGCTYTHTSSSSRTHDGVYWGENLYASSNAGTDAEAAEKATEKWSDERYYWNCGNVGSGDCKSGEQCGHLTQVIWHSTTEIGCAVQHCSTGSPFGTFNGGNWVFTMCQYKTGGNYNGQHPLGSSSTTGCAHCSSGVKDYDETDVDCGGSCVGFLQSSGGGKCAQGKTCSRSSDCAEGLVCNSETNTCSTPPSTCTSSGSCVCTNDTSATKYIKVRCSSGSSTGSSVHPGVTKTFAGCNDCELCSDSPTAWGSWCS